MDLATAGLAAVVSKRASAPVERVKLPLQTRGSDQEGSPPTALQRHPGLLREGLDSSPGRGNQANVIHYFPTQVFNFVFKGYFKSYLGRSKEKDGCVMWFVGNVASGSAADATTSSLFCHLDYARSQLGTDAREYQVQGRQQFNGLLDVYRKTLAIDGVTGLYQGFGASIMGITLYRGMYFGIYEKMKQVVLIGPLEGDFFASFFLGWRITVVSGVDVYSFDTLRRSMIGAAGEVPEFLACISRDNLT